MRKSTLFGLGVGHDLGKSFIFKLYCKKNYQNEKATDYSQFNDPRKAYPVGLRRSA
jgi:hypothetical protein